MGSDVESTKIITFSYWDKMVTQAILAWCNYQKCKIAKGTLFQLSDSVNGDQPYRAKMIPVSSYGINVGS